MKEGAFSYPVVFPESGCSVAGMKGPGQEGVIRSLVLKSRQLLRSPNRPIRGGTPRPPGRAESLHQPAWTRMLSGRPRTGHPCRNPSNPGPIPGQRVVRGSLCSLARVGKGPQEVWTTSSVPPLGGLEAPRAQGVTSGPRSCPGNGEATFPTPNFTTRKIKCFEWAVCSRKMRRFISSSGRIAKPGMWLLSVDPTHEGNRRIWLWLQAVLGTEASGMHGSPQTGRGSPRGLPSGLPSGAHWSPFGQRALQPFPSAVTANDLGRKPRGRNFLWKEISEEGAFDEGFEG